MQCIDLETDRVSEECDSNLRPESKQECNTDKCQTVSAGRCSNQLSLDY